MPEGRRAQPRVWKSRVQPFWDTFPAEGEHPGGLPEGRGWPGAEDPVPKLAVTEVRAGLGILCSPEPEESCWAGGMREYGDAEEGKAVSVWSCRSGRKVLAVAEMCPEDGTHTLVTL